MGVGFFEHSAYRVVSYGVRLEGTYCMSSVSVFACWMKQYFTYRWCAGRFLLSLIVYIYNVKYLVHCMFFYSGVPRSFVGGGGVQQIQLRTEDREHGDLGAVAS